MNNHTPGPWGYIKHNWQDTSVYAKSDGSTICTLRLSEDDATEDNQDDLEARQEANARLIAAAPDLFRALVDICTTLDDTGRVAPGALETARMLVYPNGERTYAEDPGSD